jgi:hypothetical protein
MPWRAYLIWLAVFCVPRWLLWWRTRQPRGRRRPAITLQAVQGAAIGERSPQAT